MFHEQGQLKLTHCGCRRSLTGPAEQTFTLRLQTTNQHSELVIGMFRSCDAWQCDLQRVRCMLAMQQPLCRGKLDGKTKAAARPAHDGEVRGISPDACNHHLVSVGADGWLRVWDFKGQVLSSEMDVGVAMTRLCTHPGTALVGTAAVDNMLRM